MDRTLSLVGEKPCTVDLEEALSCTRRHVTRLVEVLLHEAFPTTEGRHSLAGRGVEQLGDLLAGAGDQFLPDDGVPGVAVGLLLGTVGGGGQHGVDDVEGDRPAAAQAERLEIVDDVVGTLSGDVGGDLVTRRVQ